MPIENVVKNGMITAPYEHQCPLEWCDRSALMYEKHFHGAAIPRTSVLELGGVEQFAVFEQSTLSTSFTTLEDFTVHSQNRTLS